MSSSRKTKNNEFEMSGIAMQLSASIEKAQLIEEYRFFQTTLANQTKTKTIVSSKTKTSIFNGILHHILSLVHRIERIYKVYFSRLLRSFG